MKKERKGSMKTKLVSIAMSGVLALGMMPSMAFAAHDIASEGAAQIKIVPQGEYFGSTDLGEGEYYLTYDGEDDDKLLIVSDGGTVTPSFNIQFLSDGNGDGVAAGGLATLSPEKYTIKIEKDGEYDYEEVSAPLGVGEYRVTATAVEGSGLTGETSSYFTVYSDHDLRIAEVSYDDKYWNESNWRYEIATGTTVSPIVKISGSTVPGSGYKLSYWDDSDDEETEFANFPTKPGAYTCYIEGSGSYSGYKTIHFTVVGKSLSSATISGLNSKAYTGKNITQYPTVKYGKTTLRRNTDYAVSFTNNKNAGTATVTVKGKGNYSGTKKATFKITQAANSAKAAKTSVSKSFSAAKKTKKLAKAQTVALPKVTTKFGTAKWSVSAKDKKGVLSLKGGKVQVKKGAKKGTYTIKLKASVTKTKNYKAAATKVVTVKVTVK